MFIWKTGQSNNTVLLQEISQKTNRSIIMKRIVSSLVIFILCFCCGYVNAEKATVQFDASVYENAPNYSYD